MEKSDFVEMKNKLKINQSRKECKYSMKILLLY